MTPRYIHTSCGKNIIFQKRWVVSLPIEVKWPANTEVEVPFCPACRAIVDASAVVTPESGTCGTCKHNRQCGIQSVQVNSLVERRASGCMGGYEPRRTEPTR